MRFLFKVLLLLAVAAAGLAVWKLNAKYQGFSQPVFVEFPRGTTSQTMADTLVQKGVLESKWQFLAARAWNRGKTLQAGEYKFDRPASPLEVVGRIIRGDIFYMELLVPEGFNMFEIAKAVEKLGTIGETAFLTEARNPRLIRDLDPHAETLEGFLFPNKYRLYLHTTAQQLCRMMTAEFRKQWELIASTADVHRTITLASLVEREARLPNERPMVASVFANRLKMGMKLDCDPTTVYAALLENRYRGTIHRSDLENPSLYNTYQHMGLPPGPIANPGLSSIHAALAPAATDYLYFVAKGDGSGGHNFAETLAKHTTNIAVYRRATNHQ